MRTTFLRDVSLAIAPSHFDVYVTAAAAHATRVGIINRDVISGIVADELARVALALAGAHTVTGKSERRYRVTSIPSGQIRLSTGGERVTVCFLISLGIFLGAS